MTPENNLISISDIAKTRQRTTRRIRQIIAAYKIPIIYTRTSHSAQPRAHIESKYFNLVFDFRAPTSAHPCLATIANAAQAMSCSVWVIEQAIKRKRIKAYKPFLITHNRQTLVDLHQVKALLDHRACRIK